MSPRTKLGSISALLLGASACATLWVGDTPARMHAAAAFKVGLVVFFVWLAYPQLTQLPRRWLPFLIAALGAALLFSPSFISTALRASVLIAPLLLVLYFWNRTTPN